ncbi:MAG: YbaN family protein [Isosphaeraceae bacterium]|nr:YbaN family protein [Isosphaeraceae bacterium]
MGLLNSRRRGRVRSVPSDQASRDASIGPAQGPEIEIDQVAGSVRVCDPRVFHADRRVFCRRLVEAATRRSGVRRTEVDLGTASCRIEFGPGTTSAQDMADAFASAVREAVADVPATEPTSRRPRTAAWAVLTAYRVSGDTSLWETLDAKPGQVRLRHGSLAGGRAPVPLLAEAVTRFTGVARCRVARWSRELTIEVRPHGPVPSRLLDDVERALEDLTAADARACGGLNRTGSRTADTVVVATGMKRPVYLALAAGSFAMTLMGVVVPGIPTVPFLLATSYYLARSSPTWDAKLRRTAFFGPILEEWERFNGLSWSSKRKLIGLSVTIVVVTLAVADVTPVLLVVILVLATLSIYGVVRMPGLDERGTPIAQEHPLSLAAAAGS